MYAASVVQSRTSPEETSKVGGAPSRRSGRGAREAGRLCARKVINVPLGRLLPRPPQESPGSGAREVGSCLDLALLQNLLHGVDQGEVPLAALRHAAAPGPGCVALAGQGARRPQTLRSRVQETPTVGRGPRLLQLAGAGPLRELLGTFL